MNNCVLIFTDEYHYVSRGLFNVYKSQSAAMSETFNVIRSVNKRHWGLNEISKRDLDETAVPLEIMNQEQPGQPFFSLALKTSNRVINGILNVLGGLINGLMLPVTLLRSFRFLGPVSPDALIIHNGGWPGGYLSRSLAIAAKIRRIPVLMVIHNYPSSSQSYLFSKLVRPVRRVQTLIANQSVSNFAAVSKDLSEALLEIGLQEIKVIPNGLEIQKTNFAHRSLEDMSREVVVGFVGALVRRKGAHTLISAFATLEENAKLIIVGDGPERQHLENLAIQSRNTVHFIGNSNNVLDQMRNMDIFVVPSESFESFGMVILEAMSAGLPVVASSCGGMKEIVVDEHTGLIYPLGDSVKLADAIRRLVRAPEERLKFGRNGQERLTSTFSLRKMNNSYVKIIEQLLTLKA